MLNTIKLIFDYKNLDILRHYINNIKEKLLSEVFNLEDFFYYIKYKKRKFLQITNALVLEE